MCCSCNLVAGYQRNILLSVLIFPAEITHAIVKLQWIIVNYNGGPLL